VSEGPSQAGRERRDAGQRLREARCARSLSQRQLASLAGITRQAVAAIERGSADPSLRSALRLAQALGASVEELFGERAAPAAVSVVPLEELGERGARVGLASVGGALLAAPLDGATGRAVGFAPADGLLAEEPARVHPLGPPQPTVVVAGCDPALALLATPLARRDPPLGLLWWACGSGRALELLAAGHVHAAGIHRRDPDGRGYNTSAPDAYLGSAWRAYGFTTWRQGIVLGERAGSDIADLGDVARRRLRLANREPGSEARAVLEREREALRIEPSALPGYETHVAGHLEVAAAIAAGLADAGVAHEPAALAYGLRFLPRTEERFDLVVRDDGPSSPERIALAEVLASAWLRAQLAQLPGYGTTDLGVARHGRSADGAS